MNVFYGVLAAAFVGFVGWIANEVYIIKTNDLHHLELNLKKLMNHFSISWEN